jgi:hypothetical protein
MASSFTIWYWPILGPLSVEGYEMSVTTSGRSLIERITELQGTPQRSIFISNRFNYIYFANNKCACSTIKLALYRAELGDPEYSPVNVHKRKENPIAGPKDFTPEEFEALACGGAFRFTFVRNPYSRLASAYRDKVERLAVEKLNDLREYGDERYLWILNRDFGLRSLSEVGQFSFADFVEAICDQEPRKMNIHWRPQVINTCYELVEHDFVGRVESFANDMQRLSEAINLPIGDLAASNITNVNHHLDAYYTPEIADRVYRKFQDDFEAFGYRRELPGAS